MHMTSSPTARGDVGVVADDVGGDVRRCCGSVTKGRLHGGGGGGRRRRRRCGGGAKSPPSFHSIQLSSPQRVHNALQIV